MDGMDSSPQSTNSLRRVRSSSSTQQPFNKGAESATIETLFVHPSVKIVSFTADNAEHGTSETERIRQQAGTLSSSSRLERTIAVGMSSP